MKLFHSTNLRGQDERLVYLRVEDIQGVFPDDDGGCSVVMRGAHADLYLAESAAEVLEACGYNYIDPLPSNPDEEPEGYYADARHHPDPEGL